MTLIGDIVGRTVGVAGRLWIEGKRFDFQGMDATLPLSSVTFDEFALRSGNLNLLLGTAGANFNSPGDFLVSASVLFPLDRCRPREPMDPMIGVYYSC